MFFPISRPDCPTAHTLCPPAVLSFLSFGRQFTFPFVLAPVAHPILGADFLAHHRLLVNLYNHQVLQSSTLEPLPTSATAALLLSPFVAQLQTMPPPIRSLIAEFPTVFNSALQSARPNHGVQHHIQTTGPPVFTKTRRLDAEWLRTAKAEFDKLEAAGIICCSHSPWSSPLHLVPKPDGSW